MEERKHTSIATTSEDLIAALHLIADSVAQQRQPAARSIIYHPVYWLVMLVMLSYLHHELYHTPSDSPKILMIWCGCLIASLTLIKFSVRGYLDAAEKTGQWAWLYGDQSEQPKRTGQGKKMGKKTKNNVRFANTPRSRKSRQRDIVCVSWFRGQIIAAVVLRVVRVDRRKNPITAGTSASSCTASMTTTTSSKAPSASDSGSDSSSGFGYFSTQLSREMSPVKQSKRWKVFIRAWTVQQRYRGHGIGREVLSFAIRFCHTNRFGDPVFAEDHANSLRVLPWVFDWWMEDAEERAKVCLEREILAVREGRVV